VDVDSTQGDTPGSLQELTVRQVARQAQVSEQAVRKALAEGRLVGERADSGEWRIPKDRALAWVSRSRARRGEHTAHRPVGFLPTGAANPPSSALSERIFQLEAELSQVRAERNVYRELVDFLVARAAHQPHAAAG
jgi:hypothetical protein